MAHGKPFFRNIYKLHVYAGLFVAVHFVVFALTGLVLLFKAELSSTAGTASEAAVAPSKLPELYQAALDRARNDHPNDRPLAVFPSDDNENILNLRLGIDGETKLRGSRRLAFDLATGQDANEANAGRSDLFEWMLVLHRELFLGSNGKIYIGLVGLVYVFMLVSGFFIYGGFMRSRSFGEIRKNGIPKLTDLHKFAGVTTFAWGLIVGLSGVFLAFNGVLIKLFQYQSLKHLTARYQMTATAGGEAQAPFARVIETALSAKAGSVVSYVSFPGTEFGIPGHFLVLVNGTEALTKRISDLVVIGAERADLKEIVELPLYLKIVLLSEPLHFGDYGGLFLKIVWALFTLCSLAVVLLGATSFFMKRRQRRQASRRPVEAKTATSPQTQTQAQTPASNSNSGGKASTPRSSQKSKYAAPAALALITAFAVIASLSLGDSRAAFVSPLLLIPLATVFFFRRRRNG